MQFWGAFGVYSVRICAPKLHCQGDFSPCLERPHVETPGEVHVLQWPISTALYDYESASHNDMQVAEELFSKGIAAVAGQASAAEVTFPLAHANVLSRS
jgi:hypothetical protein